MQALAPLVLPQAWGQFATGRQPGSERKSFARAEEQSVTGKHLGPTRIYELEKLRTFTGYHTRIANEDTFRPFAVVTS